MQVGCSYKRTAIEGSFDVIVIGSGPGGLATAAFLAKDAQKRVLVLERHYTAGGLSHTFRRPGSGASSVARLCTAARYVARQRADR